MSEKDNKVNIRSALFRLIGLTEKNYNITDNAEICRDDNRFEFLIQRIDDLSEQVQNLQGLTKLLAMNQTQLASDMYVIYSQIKGISQSDLETSETESDSTRDSSISTGRTSRRRGGAGSGGMVN